MNGIVHQKVPKISQHQSGSNRASGFQACQPPKGKKRTGSEPCETDPGRSSDERCRAGVMHVMHPLDEREGMQQDAMHEVLNQRPYDDAHQDFLRLTTIKLRMLTAPRGDS